MFRISSETWKKMNTLSLSHSGYYFLSISQRLVYWDLTQCHGVGNGIFWEVLRLWISTLMRKSRWLQQHLGTGLLISMPCEGAGRVPSRYYHLCPWLSATQNYEKQISIPNSASGVQNRLSQASRTNFFEQHHLALSSCVDPVLGQSVKMSSPSSSPRQAALLT